jgi:hypothetical protein
MLTSHKHSLEKSALIALLISATTMASFLPITSASAQLFRRNRTPSTLSNGNYSQNNYRQVAIPKNTRIPLQYDGAEDKILLKADESLNLTLTVAANIKDNQGNFLIPAGTKVEGTIQPAQKDGKKGSQFVAKTLVFANGKTQSINGLSQVITRTEMVEQGASGDEILNGALIGAAAGALLGILTGDNAIATEEILGAGALGALGGWLLGGGSVELISINPDQDLNIILQQDLVIALR